MNSLSCAGVYRLLRQSMLGLAVAVVALPSWRAYGAELPSLKHPNVHKVTERVYALVGDMDVPNKKNQGFICNSAFVLTDDGVIVVDPGGSKQIGEMIIAEIRKVTDKPVTHVINTHHHADHWMGNHAFAQLKPKPQILGHPYMRDTALEIGERWLGIIGDMTGGANGGTQVVVPDRLVQGNESLKIGGLELRLVHPPHAHTKGDIAVFIPQEKVLLAGDILFYLRTPGFQDASPLGNLKALEELNQLAFDHVVPGHGPVTDKSGMKYMIDYIQLLHKEVHRLFEEGMEPYEMKDNIQIGDYKSMSGFADRFGINVNRMYYEVESSSF